MKNKRISFGSYELGATPDGLSHNGDSIKLRPKSLQVLRYLAERPGQFVSKEELLKQVWKDRVISESGPRLCIAEIRTALDDDAKNPQYLDTIAGKGYRFLQGNGGRALFNDGVSQMVGRDSDLQRMENHYRLVEDGHTQFVLLAGEPGIGKTALVTVFLERISAQYDANVMQGQCAFHHGTTEAYGPILEAVSGYCRSNKSVSVIRAMERQAPAWLRHLPEMSDASLFARPERPSEGSELEHMSREFCQLVGLLTEKKPLIIVLEDLHWADISTVDLLSKLAEQNNLSLLILGTYRPADAILHFKSLRDTIQELKGHDRCHEILLEFLTLEDLSSYLSALLNGDVSSELSARIHQRTNGNPLFMVKVIEELIETQSLVIQDGQWNLDDRAVLLAGRVPESLRAMITRHLEALPKQQQQLLAAASVAGIKFSAAAMTNVLEQSVEEIDQQCEALWADGQIIDPGNIKTWPDGTLTGSYHFQHHLYQDVIYQKIGGARRARLHRSIGERLESGYAGRTEEIAFHLAHHFDLGLDTIRAFQYLMLSAEGAINRHAYLTAVDDLNRGLEVLKQTPETAERNQQELELLLLLSPLEISTQGYSSPDSRKSLTRAEELCQQSADRASLHPVLWMLAGSRMVHGELARSRQLIEQTGELSKALADEDMALMTDSAFAQQLFFEGNFVAAREQAQSVVSRYKPDQHQHLAAAYSQEDPGIACASTAALTAWLLGDLDESLHSLQTFRKWSAKTGNPHSTGLGLMLNGMVAQLGADPEASLEYANELLALSARHNSHWAPFGMVLKGWAEAQRNPQREHLQIMQEGITEWRATGIELILPYMLGLLAETQGILGQGDAAQSSIEQALALVQKNQTLWIEAELHRIQGELTLAQDVSRQKEAMKFFQHSLAVAQKQNAKSLERRTALSLGRLLVMMKQSEKDSEIQEPLQAGIAEDPTTG